MWSAIIAEWRPSRSPSRANTVLTQKGVRLTEQAVDHCESWANADVLTTLCRRHGRMPFGS
jgi:hypothetical protein